MRNFDVFNGDADGICALHQLRLAEPLASELVTGLKHDVVLLERVPAGAGDRVTVLDISLDRNRAGLAALLARGASVRYFDHHYSGSLPAHPAFEATIDAAGLACTSELVDRCLGGRFRAWAVVGAFGDNLPAAAVRLAVTLGYDAVHLERLRDLGESLNYNAYGASEADVAIAPAALYRIVSRYADPFALAEREPIISHLAGERRADLGRAAGVEPWRSTPGTQIRILPDAAWCRRALGGVANRVALEEPHRAHAVLAPHPAGGFSVSVRSPRGRRLSAADFCRRFPGGGGRVTAAGIERLEAAGLEDFAAAFASAYAQEVHASATSRR